MGLRQKLEENNMIWKAYISSSPKKKTNGKQKLQEKTVISNCTRKACFKYEATSDVAWL